MYTKRFVCLANSRQTSGRCIAGKEIYSNGAFGAWLRPVSARPTQELHERERRLPRGGDASLLDILEIGLKEPRPHAHQSENHLVDVRHSWVRRGLCPWNELRNAVDKVESLWGTGCSSRHGINDRIFSEDAKQYRNSLLLIQPEEFSVEVFAEKTEFGERHRARGFLFYRGEEYRFSITDPEIERQYLAEGEGEYPLEQALLCVSLGEPWIAGYCYKYCAGVITPGWRG
ncbi:hypothetical protein Acid345_0957 [Candidatus Koribacter versatilis Ellin345]|uniref:Dual OB-containing domain-containing protein n=1 Tax=Koribacter versatilis (strain Ellin345) TaxID=204669 RepID=Q1IT40_KORVE|nr:hypothetical protein [Candidatus Koribacter versatilis]ABF39960.1 hypothetical protein Acid345_0957 [Candidatus Koribacter versatilis Ellin345]